MAGPIRADSSFRPSYRPAPAARPGMDADMVRVGLIAVALGGGIAMMVGAVSFMHGARHAIPVIEAEAGPVRIKPANPGGMTVTGAELSAGITGTDQQLMPAPEQPELRALRAKVREMEREKARLAAENAEVKRRALLAAATPKIAPPTAAVVAKASATTVIERPVAPVTVPASLPPVAEAAAGTQVQLAAFTDEKSARDAWSALTKKLPEILGGRTAEFAPISVAGHTMWRVRTGAFPTIAEATVFCAKLRAQSVACTVAAF